MEWNLWSKERREEDESRDPDGSYGCHPGSCTWALGFLGQSQEWQDFQAAVLKTWKKLQWFNVSRSTRNPSEWPLESCLWAPMCWQTRTLIKNNISRQINKNSESSENSSFSLPSPSFYSRDKIHKEHAWFQKPLTIDLRKDRFIPYKIINISKTSNPRDTLSLVGCIFPSSPSIQGSDAWYPHACLRK